MNAFQVHLSRRGTRKEGEYNQSNPRCVSGDENIMPNYEAGRFCLNYCMVSQYSANDTGQNIG